MITAPLWWAFILLGPAAFWLTPERWRLRALAGSSIALLAYFDWESIAWMTFMAGAVFAAHSADPEGGKVERMLCRIGRSPWPVFATLAYLAATKYLPAFALAFGGQKSLLELAIPLGVSYFSFKLIHYTIERRRENLPQHGLDEFICFMFLAPIFTAGPIERFEHFHQYRETQPSTDMFVWGGLRICAGLVKKFVLAVVLVETIGVIGAEDISTFVENLSQVHTWQIWAYLLLSLAYIYLDFSAYSDIAIGTSRLFGLRILENFNFPFLACNLQDFWTRWHMTLAGWCRTYIYMTIVGVTRNPYRAIIATFCVMGLWHAGWPAHWIFWGLWHGAGLAALLAWTRLWPRRRAPRPIAASGVTLPTLGTVATLCYVALGGAFPLLYGHLPVSASFRLLFGAFGFV